MRLATIGGTDLTVSALCLGSVAIGTTLDEAQSFRLLDAYIDAGGSFIDTANVYGKWLEGGIARSEIGIGGWLAARGGRDRVVIGTKGAHPDLQTMHISRLSPQEIGEDLDESLRNLRTDYIDIYWLHRDDPSRAVEEIIDTLNGMVRSGKIRYFGCSNWTVERIREARRYCERSGATGFVANQCMWNLASVNKAALTYPGLEIMDEASRKFHEETQMTVVPYTSQANGFFTKALRDDFATNPAYDKVKRVYGNAHNLALAERVRKLAADTGWEPTALALAYLLHQSVPTIPIIGPNNENQLVESVKALDLVMSAEMVAYLQNVG